MTHKKETMLKCLFATFWALKRGNSFLQCKQNNHPNDYYQPTGKATAASMDQRVDE